MKFIVLFVAVFALAAAAPIENDPKLAETLRYENDNIGVDGYHFAWVIKNMKTFENLISKFCLQYWD